MQQKPGALFALTGVGAFAIVLEVRWSAVHIALQRLMIGIATIGVEKVF